MIETGFMFFSCFEHFKPCSLIIHLLFMFLIYWIYSSRIAMKHDGCNFLLIHLVSFWEFFTISKNSLPPPSPTGPPKFLIPTFNQLPTIGAKWNLMYVFFSLFLGRVLRRNIIFRKIRVPSPIDRILKFFPRIFIQQSDYN